MLMSIPNPNMGTLSGLYLSGSHWRVLVFLFVLSEVLYSLLPARPYSGRLFPFWMWISNFPEDLNGVG
jgi:hypothetical protein